MMTNNVASLRPFLICRSGVRSCGFPLLHVAETMRALPVEPVPDMPPFVAGVSIIRGNAVPVVTLASLFGESDQASSTRFVTVKLDDRLVAFAVDGVIGIGQIAIEATHDLPPLLGEANSSMVSTIGIRDKNLFSVLEASRVVPESVWQNLASRGKPS